MGEMQISLTGAERDCLVELLNTWLKETRVEEHRTRTPSYREAIEQREAAINSVLAKLAKPAG